MDKSVDSNASMGVNQVNRVCQPARDDHEPSVDVVDYAFVPSSANGRHMSSICGGKPNECQNGDTNKVNQNNGARCGQSNSKLKPDGERKTADNWQHIAGGESKVLHQLHASNVVKNSIASTIEKRLPLFQFHRKKSDPTNHQTIAGKERPKFVKCASIARLFGNTYSTQNTQNALHGQQQLSKEQDGSVALPVLETKTSKASNAIVGNRIGVKSERFRKCPENHVENGEPDENGRRSSVQVKDFCEDKDLSARALRSLSKSIGRLWRRSHSVDISSPDPEYKVLYLGNVLTGWAKGKHIYFISSFFFILF